MDTISADDLRRYPVPERCVTLWWLGQTGFLIKSPHGKIVVIDPYLSNSAKPLGEQNGLNFDRLVPPPLPPQLLRTNLIVEGIGDRYRELEHAKPFTFPEATA